MFLGDIAKICKCALVLSLFFVAAGLLFFFLLQEDFLTTGRMLAGEREEVGDDGKGDESLS